ncbi:MAG: MotA/TolQ/ExbB proton channel family protein [Prevotella sp.]|nr:MotA/TolQ/ExbB proton channel family protein [Prevotella sp.]
MIVLGLTIDPALAQTDSAANDIPTLLETDSLAATALDGASVEELIGDEDMNALQTMAMGEGSGLHEQLKSKFVEGSAEFMSLVALALVIGLALCIERIIYLTLSEINAKKLLIDIEKKVDANDVEGAKSLCRETRGPVASICYQGLMHANEDMATVERSIVSYGTVQSGKLEKGCSWIRLMIAIAPSLGFLGTVIGMVMAFDRIQEIGDISPTIVAEGMKVALITTIFGIIVAIILQIFYNFILSRIERLTTQMEESAITLLDIIMKHKLSQG